MVEQKDVKRMAGLPWKERVKSTQRSVTFPGEVQETWAFPRVSTVADFLDIITRSANGWISRTDMVADYLALHPRLAQAPLRAEQIILSASQAVNVVLSSKDIPWRIHEEERENELKEVVDGYSLKRTEKLQPRRKLSSAMEASRILEERIRQLKQ